MVDQDTVPETTAVPHDDASQSALPTSTLPTNAPPTAQSLQKMPNTKSTGVGAPSIPQGGLVAIARKAAGKKKEKTVTPEQLAEKEYNDQHGAIMKKWVDAYETAFYSKDLNTSNVGWTCSMLTVVVAKQES